MRYLLLTLLFTVPAFAASDSKLTDLSVEYKHSIHTNRHWNIPENEPKQGELNLHIRHDGKYLYTQTTIHTMFTVNQFRYGALESEVGFKVGEAEVFIHHKSEHAFDMEYKEDYPNQNSVGLRLKLN